MRNQKRTSRRAVRGVALIEALVGVLIFALGIIGLVGLQVAMTRAQGAAKIRADANNLGSEVIGIMWADRANLQKYNGAACESYDPCQEWTDKVAAALPGGEATLSYDAATGGVGIEITWSSPAEGNHRHVLTTSIR